MSLRLSLALALAALAVGCPAPAEMTDTGPVLRDTPALTDTPGAPSDSPSTSDTPTVAADAGNDTGGIATPVRFGDVHPSLVTSCSPCHASGSHPAHNMARADVDLAYASSQETSTGCAGGISKAACAARRVRDGSMPPGGGLSEPARTNLANLLDGFVASGQMR